MMRAQASMEYLMTYGFGILILIATIAILASVGISKLDINNAFCIFPPGMDCIGKPVLNENHILISIRNNLGEQILNDAQFSVCSNPMGSVVNINNTYSFLPLRVPNNQIVNINLSCNFEKGKRISESITLLFYNEGSAIEIAVLGEIKGKIN